MSALAINTVPPHLPRPAAPAASISRAAFTSGGVALLLLFPLVLTAVLTPKFVEIFKDFGVALSPLSRLFINFGMSLATPLGAAAAVFLVGVLTTAAALLAYRWRIGAMLVWLLAIGAFIGYLALFFIAMQMPLMAMIKSLQQGGAV